MRRLAVVLLLFAVSCAPTRLLQLEPGCSYDLLVRRQPLQLVDEESEQVVWPVVLTATTVPFTDTTSLIPYARWREHTHGDEGTKLRIARRRGAVYGADVAIIRSSGSRAMQSGLLGSTQVSSAWAVDFGSSEVDVAMYRAIGADLGFVLGAAAIVTHLRRGGAAAVAGMLPGDVVLAVAGIGVDGYDVVGSMHWQRLAQLEVGQAVLVEWIRPGVGPMKAELVAQASDPSQVVAGLKNYAPAIPR